MNVAVVLGVSCGALGVLLLVIGIVLLAHREEWIRVPARAIDIRRGGALTHDSYLVEYPGPHGEPLRAWATYTANTGAELLGFSGVVWVNPRDPRQVRLNAVAGATKAGAGLVAAGIVVLIAGIAVAVIISAFSDMARAG